MTQDLTATDIRQLPRDILQEPEFQKQLRAPQSERGEQGPPGLTAKRIDTSWYLPHIGFFDPEAEGAGGMVTRNTVTFFNDVMLFIARLEDLMAQKSPQVVRSNLSSCLRGSALMWYMMELSHQERANLRAKSLTDENGWFDALKKRFKMKSFEALRLMLNTIYTWQDVSDGITVTSYAHEIIRLCNSIEPAYSACENMLCIHSNLDPRMSQNVPLPTPSTVLSEWLRKLEVHYDNWSEMMRAGEIQY